MAQRMRQCISDVTSAHGYHQISHVNQSLRTMKHVNNGFSEHNQRTRRQWHSSILSYRWLRRYPPPLYACMACTDSFSLSRGAKQFSSDYLLSWLTGANRSQFITFVELKDIAVRVRVCGGMGARGTATNEMSDRAEQRQKEETTQRTHVATGLSVCPSVCALQLSHY